MVCCHQSNSVIALEALQRVQIEVIVVIVAHQHDVDARQLFEREARWPDPTRPAPLHRAHAIGVHRVGQHVQSRKLQQQRRVVDVSDREFAALEARGQARPNRVFDLDGPACPTARTLPANEVSQRAPGRRGRVLIAEDLAIEMIGGRAAVARAPVQRTLRCVRPGREAQQLGKRLLHARCVPPRGQPAASASGRLLVASSACSTGSSCGATASTHARPSSIASSAR
jgi:hypothetical protein